MAKASGTAHPNFKNLASQKFGRLCPISWVKKSRIYWSCTCSCGGHTLASSCGLLSGKVQSCGCLRREKMRLQGPITLKEYVENSPKAVAKRAQANSIRLKAFRTSALNVEIYRQFNAQAKIRFRNQRISRGLPPDIPIGEQLHYIMRTRLFRAIMERDHFICAGCNQHGKLQVHHIIPKSKAPFVLWTDPSNLITLCKTCHVDVIHRGNFCGDPDPLWSYRLLIMATERNNTEPIASSIVIQTAIAIQEALLGRGTWQQ